ncbi:hypothetical protein EMIT0P176_40125 [Pseudomonas sp. IT-P176]
MGLQAGADTLRRQASDHKASVARAYTGAPSATLCAMFLWADAAGHRLPCEQVFPLNQEGAHALQGLDGVVGNGGMHLQSGCRDRFLIGPGLHQDGTVVKGHRQIQHRDRGFECHTYPPGC